MRLAECRNWGIREVWPDDTNYEIASLSPALNVSSRDWQIGNCEIAAININKQNTSGVYVAQSRCFAGAWLPEH
jgi:hypothetical protein